jgi:hypothetical protein
VETVIAAGPAMETVEALDSAEYSHPPKDAQTFSLTKNAQTIQGYALDCISDYVAGQPRGVLWRKTLVEASSLVRTIIET